jgi:hypothetical protein
MPRKAITDMIGELRSWLPNYDHGPEDFPTLFWRVLASLPGGDEAADMGYEAFNLGWKEAELLGDTLNAIQDASDVQDLIAGLLRDEEEVEERRRRRPVQEVRRNPMARAPARPIKLDWGVLPDERGNPPAGARRRPAPPPPRAPRRAPPPPPRSRRGR